MFISVNSMAKTTIFVLVASLAVSVCAQISGTNSTRVIAADWQNVKGPKSELFHECIDVGRAAEGLRADWQRQLKMCQDEIGFKYLRFHGILTDDMGVYSEHNGESQHNWQYVDQLYDALLDLHIRPFVELSFMPAAIASGTRRFFGGRAT